MKGLKIILTFLIFTTDFSTFGQPVSNECDTVYNFVETMPQYKNDVKGLIDYLKTELEPILTGCYKRDGILIAVIYTTLIINKEGKVIDVEFKKFEASEQCQEELRNKLLDMTAWNPGKQNGNAVCCRYH